MKTLYLLDFPLVFSIYLSIPPLFLKFHFFIYYHISNFSMTSISTENIVIIDMTILLLQRYLRAIYGLFSGRFYFLVTLDFPYLGRMGVLLSKFYFSFIIYLIFIIFLLNESVLMPNSFIYLCSIEIISAHSLPNYALLEPIR